MIETKHFNNVCHLNNEFAIPHTADTCFVFSNTDAPIIKTALTDAHVTSWINIPVNMTCGWSAYPTPRVSWDRNGIVVDQSRVRAFTRGDISVLQVRADSGPKKKEHVFISDCYWLGSVTRGVMSHHYAYPGWRGGVHMPPFVSPCT